MTVCHVKILLFFPPFLFLSLLLINHSGLKAFVKYVPRDVVRLMLRGDMSLDNTMVRKTITILFMDIASFSTLCEKISAEQLVTLTSDYLQAMCEIIVRSGGVLDKVVPYLQAQCIYA